MTTTSLRVHAAENDAGALLQQVAVDLVAAQQRDAPVPVGALGPDPVELRLRP